MDNKLDYEFKSEQFEGPLEVLLQLIEEQKLDITQVSLANVADQFIEHFKSLDDMPTATIADFLVIAARLLTIKSRLLESNVFEPDEESSELEKQLKIYKEYAEASKIIEKMLQRRKFLYNRAKPAIAFVPEFAPPEFLTGQQMAEIFKNAIARVKPIIDLPKQALKKVITITEKILAIRSLVANKLNLTFKELLTKGDRLDIVVSFLAILELVKQRNIIVSQSDHFEEIEIKKIGVGD